MKYQLTAHEARVIGCLLEKQVTTPEQYPLSVNAVVTACNQKTNREPVMSLSESEVQALLDTLVKRHYLRTVSGFGNRVTKYEQRFCNSEFGDLKLSAGEVAVVTTLLLRGAQTPGELRSRAQRMYEFSDMAEVESVLEGLTTREDGPFVARLPREPGKRESRYMHLFCDDMDTLITTVEALAPLDDDGDLRARVEALEGEAASLRMDKHRSDSVGNDLRFTLLDDYLHVVDTALWLADGQARLRGGALKITPQGEMLYAEHQFSSPRLQVTTSMHRRAGSQREWVQAVTDGGLYAVSEMREWQEECGHGVVQRPVAGWQTTLEQRGFVGCARHFIECVQNQTVPETAGEQALLAQRIVEKLWRDAISE